MTIWGGDFIQDKPFIKTSYYSGKLLHAYDFINEQKYGNDKLEFINRKFQGSGIIEGLNIRSENGSRIKITAGSAIDLKGRIILAPQDKEFDINEIENFKENAENDFILGIYYAEQSAETERAFLEKNETYKTARTKETYGLKAYTPEEWQKLCNEGISAEYRSERLVQEKVLYENERIRLIARLPKLIPENSIFRIRVQVQAVNGCSTEIRWRGMATLQGAFFATSGGPVHILEKELTKFSGTIQQEWDICTEENRKIPITLELNHLEVAIEGSGTIEVNASQFYIVTTTEYHTTVRKYLWEEKGKSESNRESYETDWIPLAHLKVDKTQNEGQYSITKLNDDALRFYTARPGDEEFLRRITEENGIIDIRWRGLLRNFNPVKPLPSPVVPEPAPFLPKPSEDLPEWIKELVHKERDMCIRRGIAVIPIPKHYRKGQVLLSEEISHGFPGEEAFIWWGEISEERNYAFWDRNKMRYSVIQGEQRLFDDTSGKGWHIQKHALRQNVEAGTFELAITLSGKFWEDKGREVAISWIAFKTI